MAWGLSSSATSVHYWLHCAFHSRWLGVLTRCTTAQTVMVPPSDQPHPPGGEAVRDAGQGSCLALYGRPLPIGLCGGTVRPTPVRHQLPGAHLQLLACQPAPHPCLALLGPWPEHLLNSLTQHQIPPQPGSRHFNLAVPADRSGTGGFRHPLCDQQPAREPTLLRGGSKDDEHPAV